MYLKTSVSLTVSCFSKIQIGFAFLVLAYPGSPGKGSLNGCVYLKTSLSRIFNVHWLLNALLLASFAGHCSPLTTKKIKFLDHALISYVSLWLCCCECVARRPQLKICCTDVTASCANNGAINVYIFVHVMLFTKKNIIFLNILKRSRCYTACIN